MHFAFLLILLQMFLPIDTTRASDSVPEMPIDQVYTERLQALPFVVEVPYNPVVRRYIDSYLNPNSTLLSRILVRSQVYFPLIDDALCRYELPYELCYLPVIESALNPDARSPMGAVGLWQFIPSTGRLYGLEINSLVDERRDPIKSTEAACRFLKNLYATFGDWNLALAAYNCGPGNVNKAIARSGGKRDFWSIYPYLPRETRGYVPIYIAACYAMNYAPLHGIPESNEWTMQIDGDTIVTSERQHFEQIANYLDVTVDELRNLNPQYTMDIVPGGRPYSICLPHEVAADYIQYQDSILTWKADSLIHSRRAVIEAAKLDITTYKVKRGDSLGAIAKKYHVSVKQLKQWNGLKNDFIREGQKLRIGR